MKEGGSQPPSHGNPSTELAVSHVQREPAAKTQTFTVPSGTYTTRATGAFLKEAYDCQ